MIKFKKPKDRESIRENLYAFWAMPQVDRDALRFYVIKKNKFPTSIFSVVFLSWIFALFVGFALIFVFALFGEPSFFGFHFVDVGLGLVPVIFVLKMISKYRSLDD